MKPVMIISSGMVWCSLYLAIEIFFAPWCPREQWLRIAAIQFGITLAIAGSLIPAQRFLGMEARGLGALLILVSVVALPFNIRQPRAVIWVVSDTLRADFMSVYGYPTKTTPFLEDWGTEAITFDQAYSQGSHTIVSAPSILASLYPSTHELKSYRDVLSSKAHLISEILREDGYQTFGAVSNPHLGPRNGFNQGWDEYRFPSSWKELPSARINNAFFAWRKKLDANPRYFALLWYIDPHTPIQWDDRAAKLTGLAPEETFTYTPQPSDDSAPEAERARARKRYEAAVLSIDNSISSLISFLRSQSDYQDSVIFFTSDHGESHWEHGRYGHNYHLYESLTHVPLMIRFPSPLRFPHIEMSGFRDSRIVSNVDLLPTLLEYLGLRPSPFSQGSSFLSGMGTQQERSAYLEERLVQYGPYFLYGLRVGNYKYIWEEQFEDRSESRFLLFDVKSDPGETRNLAQDLPEVFDTLKRHTETLRSRASSRGQQPKQILPDEQTRNLLELLGYLETEESESEARAPAPAP